MYRWLFYNTVSTAGLQCIGCETVLFICIPCNGRQFITIPHRGHCYCYTPVDGTNCQMPSVCTYILSSMKDIWHHFNGNFWLVNINGQFGGMWSASKYYLSIVLQEKVKKTESFNQDIQCLRCVTYSFIRNYCKQAEYWFFAQGVVIFLGCITVHNI